MSLRLVTPTVNTNIPGAYPTVTVQSQPVGLGNSGIIAIIGEAEGGPSYQQVTLSTNSFNPTQLQQVQQNYISGEIVDAFSALAAPSSDPAITGTANQIFILKTNTSSKASLALASSYGIISDSNYGTPGNLYQIQLLSVAPEQAPTVTGTVISTFGAPLNGTSFTIRDNGGQAYVITLSGTPTDHNSISTLASELNGYFSADSLPIVASPAVSPTNALTLTVTADASAWGKGYGKSFELYDSTPTDLAALGLTASLIVSAQEPEIEISIVNTSAGINQSPEATATVALEIGYQGTTATLTIADGVLSTTVTGGSGGNLSITLSQYTTILELAGYIASQPGYSALCPPSSQQLSPSVLDEVTAIGISSSGTGLLPGRIKDAAYSFQQAMSTSILTFTPGSGGTQGLPAPTSAYAFLAGGTRGGTANSDIVNCLAQLAGVQCNIIVTLFSQDYTADITAGNTDPSSTYTISSINALVKSHCIEYTTPTLKKNRQCILSYNGTYANAKSQAQSLGNYLCSLTMQQVNQTNSTGTLTRFLPWYGAVLAAGMQAGGFYKAIVNKQANLVSYVDPSGFDSGDPGDVMDALSAGLLILSQDTSRAGYWVSDSTTYSYDSNFVYNSIQAVYTSNLVALDLALSFQQLIAGQSDADIDAGAGLTLLATKMAGYKQLKLIAGSSDAPLGYKNASVTLIAPTMYVGVEIKLSTAIYFVPININVSQVMNAATSGT